MSDTELLSQGLLNVALESNDVQDDRPRTSQALSGPQATDRLRLENEVGGIALLVNSIKLVTTLNNIYGLSGCFPALASERVAQGAYFQVRKTDRTEQNTAAKYPRQILTDSSQTASGLTDLEAVRLELNALTHPPLRKHPHIVDIIGLSWARLDADSCLSMPVLYLEFAAHGSLAQYLADDEVSPRDRIGLAKQVADGLDILHVCGITHGDLKLENVLVFPGKDGNVIAKLADFGCSTQIVDRGWQLRGGTQPWNAPEWRQIIPTDMLHAPDIYSLGLLIWRLCLEGQNPFGTMGLDEIESRKTHGITILDAENSIERYYRFYRSIHQPASDSEVFDDYLLLVVMPTKAIRASVLAEPSRRSLSTVRAALSEQVVFGVEKPFTLKPGDHPRFDPGRAQNHYMQLFDAPRYVRKMHLEHLERLLQGKNLSAFERGDLCLQLAFANIDGFVDFQDFELAKRWLISAAQLDHLPAQEIAYRILHSCDVVNPRGATMVTEEQLIAWLSRAATAGSNIALQDLRILAPAVVRRGFNISRDRAHIRRMLDCFSEDKLEWLFSSVNVSGLAAQARSGGTEGLVAVKFDDELNTMLHYAAVFCSSMDEFQNVIAHFDDLNVTNKIGNTALHLAMLSGNASHARIMLLRGADPNVKNKKGQVAYHWIVDIPRELGATELLELFLDKDADLEASATFQRPRQEYRHNGREGTVLELAVFEDRLDLVRVLLRRGADPTVSPRPLSPVLRSISMHRWEILQEFLPYIRQKPLVLGRDIGWFRSDESHVGRADLASFAVGSHPKHDRMIIHGHHYRYAFKKTMKILSSENLLPKDLTNAIWYAASVGHPDKVEILLQLHEGFPASKSSVLMQAFEKGIGQIGQVTALTMLAWMNQSTLQQSLAESDLLNSYVRSLSPTPLVLEVLLRASGTADIEKWDPEGRNLFANAVESSHYELATHLLKRGAKAGAMMPDRTSHDRTEPCVSIVYNIIGKDSDLSVYPLRYLLEPLHPYKDNVPGFVVYPRLKLTALHAAAQWEEQAVFNYILAKYHHPEHLSARAINGWTALHFAAHFGNLMALQRLCDLKVPLNLKATEKYGRMTALDLCTSILQPSTNRRRNEEYWERLMIRRFQIWIYLKQLGARSSKRRPPPHKHFLIKALREGWCDLTTEVLESLRNTEDYANYLNASLHQVSSSGHSQVAEKLIILGADINDRTAQQRTPLHTAVRYRNAQIARILVLAGADQAARDLKGRTPIMEAFVNEDQGFMDYLLQCGSTPEFPVAFSVEADATIRHGEGEAAKDKVERVLLKGYLLEWKEFRDGEWHKMSSAWPGSPRAAKGGILETIVNERDQRNGEAEELGRQRTEKRKFFNIWQSSQVS